MRKAVEILLYLIVIVLLLASAYGALSTDEMLIRKEYTIEIAASEWDRSNTVVNPVVLHEFQFEYDFTKNRGNISFKFPRAATRIALEYKIPEEVDNETLTIKLKDENGSIELNNRYWSVEYKTGENGLEQSHITINILQEIKENDRMEIIFFSKLKPKGHYNFLIAPDVLLYRPRRAENIQLILGNNYKCIFPCVSDLYNVQELPKSDDNVIRLRWQINDKERNNAFILQSYARRMQILKNLIFTLSIAFVAPLTISLISLLKSDRDFDYKRMKEIINEKIRIRGIGRKTLKKLKEEIRIR